MIKYVKGYTYLCDFYPNKVATYLGQCIDKDFGICERFKGDDMIGTYLVHKDTHKFMHYTEETKIKLEIKEFIEDENHN